MRILTINPKTGKPQSWEVRLTNVTYLRLSDFIGVYSDDTEHIPNVYKLHEQLKKIQGATFNNLEFIPLTEEGANLTDEELCASHYRGEGKYNSNAPKTPDENAWVIRKQKIDFVVNGTGVYYFDPDQSRAKHINFQSWISNHSLTKGQRDTIKEWFEKQIIDAVTPEVMDKVKAEYRDKIIAYVKKDIPKVIGWLKLLEAFQG